MRRKLLSLFLAATLLCTTLCISAAAAPTTEEVKQEIYDYLVTDETGLKCSTAVACGIMANIQAVSKYNPERIPSGSTADTATAYGLCQWTGDRYEALKKFDPEYSTVNAQMRFLHYELLTSEAKSWAKINAQTDDKQGAYSAAVLFAKDFLRISHVYEGVDQYDMVGSIAATLYGEITGTTDSDSSTDPVTDPTTDSTTEPTVDTGSTFLSLPAKGTYTEGMFLDVSAKSWYYTGVVGAVKFNLMKGQADKIFAPSGSVTLAEIITMAARLNCIYTNGEDTIAVTSGKTWYQPYVEYAVANGILDASYKDKSAKEMNAKVNRADAVVILAKSLPDTALVARNTIADNAIPDVKSSAAYAPSVYLLYRAGVLTGGLNNNFLPWNSITRAEMATIMTRMADTESRVSFTIK